MMIIEQFTQAVFNITPSNNSLLLKRQIWYEELFKCLLK